MIYDVLFLVLIVMFVMTPESYFTNSENKDSLLSRFKI